MKTYYVWLQLARSLQLIEIIDRLLKYPSQCTWRILVRCFILNADSCATHQLTEQTTRFPRSFHYSYVITLLVRNFRHGSNGDRSPLGWDFGRPASAGLGIETVPELHHQLHRIEGDTVPALTSRSISTSASVKRLCQLHARRTLAYSQGMIVPSRVSDRDLHHWV
jgi:hypothetical protein